MNRIVAVLVLFCGTALAQSRTTDWSYHVTHGGWGFRQDVGADGPKGDYRGDPIVIDVRCDHDYFGNGQCFDGAPDISALLDGALPGLELLDDGTDLDTLTDLPFEQMLLPHAQRGGLEFTRVYNGYEHQRWAVRAPYTGRFIVRSEYYWVGWGVHYWFHVIAREKPAI